MKESPLVTIAIPCFKAKYLDKAITSALSQTWNNIEVIVVDDSSPNDILSIVKRFNDERLKYVRNEKNLGVLNPALNWNRCIELAKGDFFCLLCDDDVYEPEFVETLLSLADNYPECNTFRTRADIVDINGNVIGRYASSPLAETWEDYLWHVANGYRTQTISEWMYRTGALRENGGFASLPLAWYADYLTIFRIARNGGIVSTSNILVHFRQSGENISSRDSDNTEKKIQASQQYRCEVEKLLNDSQDKLAILNVLDKLLKQHLKYNLNHANRKTICGLLLKYKKYNLHIGWLWKAFWHTIFNRR